MSNSYYPSLKELAEKLDAKKHQGYYMARCPAHDDDTASLSLSEKKGKILFKCHAGCPQDDIVEALRQSKFWPERNSNGQAGQHRTIVAQHNYENETGEILFQAVRISPKGFFQRRPDGNGGWINSLDGVPVVPYRLPDIEEGIALGREIWIVEGEKDADNLAKLGFRATCNAGGAGKWRSEHSAYLKGADVIIIPDNDEPGRKHGKSVAASLKGIAARIRILDLPDLPEKGDVSDWLAAGGEAWQLLMLADQVTDGPKKKAPKDKKSAETDLGDMFPHWNVEPWPEQVSGAELLSELVAFLKRFIVLPEHGAEIIALWVLHAWAINSFDISPFLFIRSPTKQCGKTTLLILINYLTPRSVAASNISPAALFRFIEDESPTLLIDEADSFARENEELRNVLNAGHTRASARTIRCETVGGTIKPRAFSTWAPKVIAAIGVLPGTIMDRSIVIVMRRKKKTERVEKLRLRDSDEFIRLRRRAMRWAADSSRDLEGAEPKMPAALANRLEDNWLPLFAIAELARGDWSARTAVAARSISGAAKESDLSVELLRDIRQLFDDERRAQFGAEELTQRLIAMPETPWAELRPGKEGPRPLTSRGLATMLSEYEISSDSKTRGPRLYHKLSFEEAWDSYLSA